LNLDTNTLKFANPLSVFYLDSPSKDLVEQIVQGASRLTPAQVSEFVGLAATILKTYKARETNHKDAINVRFFHRFIIYPMNFFSRKLKISTKLFQNF
jgi:hypothetical protein